MVNCLTKLYFMNVLKYLLKTVLIWFYAKYIAIIHKVRFIFKDSVTSAPAFAFQEAFENHL
jgi:hypothetical protein